MKENVLFKASAPLVLVVFTFVSCSSPFFYTNVPKNSTPINEIASVPIGQGTPVFAYLDDNNNPSETDTGTTAVVVTDNELAAGVTVLSQIPHNDPAYDNVVRVVNSNNNSFVSMFFREDQRFPYRMAITRDGEEITAQFSRYNSVTQTFSLAVQGDESDFFTLPDITMNNGVFSLWQDKPELDDSQNTRMRNMITALCIWDSIALQIPDSGFTVNSHLAPSRNWFTDLFSPKNILRTVFTAIAVVCFVAAVIICPPAVIVAPVSVTLTLGTVTPIATVLYATSAAAAIIAAGNAIAAQEDLGAHSVDAPTPDPAITVKKGDDTVPNNGTAYSIELANIGDSITFDVVLHGGSEVSVSQLTPFDPFLNMFIPSTQPNAYWFQTPAPISDESGLHYTINRIHSGSDENRRVQYIISFGRDVKINGSGAGIMFQDSPGATPRIRKDIFIINIDAS